MDMYLYVMDEPNKGDKQQALKLQLTNAHVNGTILEERYQNNPHMMILITGIQPGNLVSSESTFGPVNDLLL